MMTRGRVLVGGPLVVRKAEEAVWQGLKHDGVMVLGSIAVFSIHGHLTDLN